MTPIAKLYKNFNHSRLCVGLDPDDSKLDGESVINFLIRIVDATHRDVCAYKPNKAFFKDERDLADIIEYIHFHFPHIPVILDCKIGDIGNTMGKYAEMLVDIEADGVVLNPYMGREVLDAIPEPLIRVVCAQTSNDSDIQNIVADGKPVWRHVLDKVIEWDNGCTMVVLSSRSGITRSDLPDDMPVLLAGIGAQGGDATALTNLLDSRGLGVMVNSSRDIIYSSNPAKAARDMRIYLNTL